MKKEKKSLTKEQKSEIIKLTATGLLALVAITAVILVFKFYSQTVNRGNQPDSTKNEITDLKDITLSSKLVAVPYVKTDIDGVVYSANAAGSILFYEFNGTEYTQLAETGTTEVVVPLSGQQIPVKIHYIERDGKLAGYGVYTPDENDTVYIYDFLLCKITNLPKGYTQNGKCLLVANTDINAVYSNNPVWEEAFVLDRASGKMTRFISDGNRMLDTKGAVRSDFATFTDSEIKSASGVIPFFTGRAYEISNNVKFDLYLKNQKNESLAVKDVLDKYTKITDDGGIVYIKATTGGFSTVKYLDGKSSVINDFYSAYGEQYFRSGDWILSREDGRLYSTYSDKIIELPQFVMNPSDFAVSPDGKYVVLIGMAANAADYQIWIYNIETGKSMNFSDDDYSTHYNLSFVNNSAICFYTVTAEGYNEKIIDVSKVS